MSKRARVPDGLWQCPGCGTPVTVVEFRTVKTPDGQGYGLLLEDCDHVVALELIRDAWGVDIPDPDPLRVAFTQD